MADKLDSSKWGLLRQGGAAAGFSCLQPPLHERNMGRHVSASKLIGHHDSGSL